MFHGKHARARAAAWAGLELDARQLRLLDRYAVWLGDEAIPAGGLGPSEADRLWDRHLVDSLLFAGLWGRPEPPATLLDIGSGVGLPGIPLAIAWPETMVTLLDRSGRRGQLARRALRVLGAENATVVVANVAEQAMAADFVVTRAALPLDHAVVVVADRLLPGGIGGFGLSRRARPEMLPAPPPDRTLDLVTVPLEVLDSPVWLLRMATTE